METVGGNGQLVTHTKSLCLGRFQSDLDPNGRYSIVEIFSHPHQTTADAF